MNRLRYFVFSQSLILLLFYSFCNAQSVNSYTISGVVVSEEDGDVLPGVAISVGETSQRTVTDVDGKFIISLTNSPVILHFFFFFMKKTSITVNLQTKEITVIL